jgi:hypothetical protein
MLDEDLELFASALQRSWRGFLSEEFLFNLNTVAAHANTYLKHR